jgi:hypothetical protein
MSDGRINFQAPGPVTAAYMAAQDLIRAIMGPIGSAKTSTCLMDFVYKAQSSHPQGDGWRRFKTVVVRDTYRNLEKTTIPSWHRWFSKDIGEWSGGEGGRPGKHVIRFECPDGVPLEYIAEFIGLNENKVEDVMRGYEFTAAYLNEADLLSRDALTYIVSRLGRYPPRDAYGNGATWWGAGLDFNAPDTENWTYEDLVEKPIEASKFFRQPGGLEAGAENLENLPGGRRYYEQLVMANPEWWVRRYVHNRFGYSRTGKPIYPEFNDARHVARSPLIPVPGIPIILGADAGGTPGGALMQQMRTGQWWALDEIVSPANEVTGPLRFAKRINLLLAEERYRRVLASRLDLEEGEQAIIGYCDPSALYGADRQAGEKNWMEAVAHATQIRFKPAPTNEPTIRMEAVRRPLVDTIDGTEPGFLLSPMCRVLRKAFNSGYRFRKLQIAGVDRYDDRAEKNEFSHVMEGLQYGMSGGGEHLEVTGRRERRERARRSAPAQVQNDYDPMSW